MTVKVTRATDPNIKGVKGKIVDESRNMLTLQDGGRRLLIPKSVATFRFKLRDGMLVEVDGQRLVARPENRLKTKVRRW